jgi:plastocyanin
MRCFGYCLVGIMGLWLLVGCGRSDEGERQSTPATSSRPETSPPPSSTTESQTDARLIEVDLSVFKFTPKTIALKAGEPVQFRVTSKDTLHTFTVKDLGIDVALNPGESKVSEVFTPQETGTFQITCRIHAVSAYGMEGFLEITETGEPAR